VVNARAAKPSVEDQKRRAAEYIRMSTEHQKYSPENQRTAIAAYAAERDIAIVRRYADEGRSGLTISKRNGLSK
jgi:DNA invertase Pin-like site-specific DNA recombinase